MTIYYIRPDGNNTNSGLAATAAGAWQTLNKALTNGVMADGDTVRVAPGTYRDVFTFAATPAAMRYIIGDPSAEFFPDLDGGLVTVSSYATVDTAIPGANPPFNFNGKNFWTVENINIIGGQASSNNAGSVCGTGSHDITFRNCSLTVNRYAAAGNAVYFGGNIADQAANILFERCIFTTTVNGTCFRLDANYSATAEFDINVTLRNCVFMPGNGGLAVQFVKAGANTLQPSGLRIDHCTFIGGAGISAAPAATIRNPKFPHVVTHNVFWGCSAGIGGVVAAEGSTIEDYNYFNCLAAPRTNVLPGAQSVLTIVPFTLSQGQEWLYGQRPRPPWTPLASSSFLNWNNSRLAHSCTAGTAGSESSVGTIAWTNPGNTNASDDTYAVATAIPATTGVSQYLKLTNFGFAVPSDCVIEGVVVHWERSASAISAISTNSVKLTKGGTIVGSEMVGTDTATWLTTDLTMGHGGAQNLWGTTLTPAEVNASTFGVCISAKNTAAGTQDAKIDFVRVIVWYKTADGTSLASVDLLNRLRPYGTSQLAACGALERGNTARKNLATYHTAAPAASIDGFNYQDFQVPVGNVATTLKMWMTYNAAYTGPLPQLWVIDGKECGVADVSQVMTAAADVWEQVSITITPTRAGLVTLSVVSRAATVAGILTFDDAEIV